MPPWLLPRTLFAATLLLTTAPAEMGCLFPACTDIGCGGGFEWVGSATDDTPLVPGVYAVELAIEASRYTVSCTIAESIAASTCTQPLQSEGAIAFSVSFSLSTVPTEDWDPQTPPGGFYLSAVDRSESDPDGSFSASRGPTRVGVEIVRDDTPFVTVEYEEITYRRDDDDRCGYCDQLQSRETLWSPRGPIRARSTAWRRG